MTALAIFATGTALCVCLIVAIFGTSMWLDSRRCSQARRAGNVALLSFSAVCFVLAAGLAAMIVEKV